MVVDLERLRQPLAASRRRVSPIAQRIAAIGQDHDELVAAEPARPSRRSPATSDQALADLDQQLVAGRVAERVVDVLEAVEIEQRDRGRLGAAVAGEQASQLLLQRQAVGQPGQLIVMRELAAAAPRPACGR